MSAPPLPFHVTDLAALARHLAQEIAQAPRPPDHLDLMDMLARGAGFAGASALRASAMAGVRLAEPGAMADLAKVRQARSCFDTEGRLARWPAKTQLQELCLWGIWARWPKGAVYSEREASALITSLHLFGDAAIIRRTMWEMRLISRSADGRDYKRIEQAPGPEAKALIAALRGGG